MVAIEDVIIAIKMALKNMEKEYCTLSQIDYRKIEMEKEFKEHISKEKYLERPFAYEFYYQFRKLMHDKVIEFGGPIIQAEVDKRYQHCFKKGKIPDFIIHVPNSQANLAVIEFKLATNLNKNKLKHDFEKLVEFKEHPDLKYSYIIEVIIGDKNSLKKIENVIEDLNKPDGVEIVIIWFDTDSWQASEDITKF